MIKLDANKVHEIDLSRFKPLTRRQFKLILVMNGFGLDEVFSKINAIEDETLRQITLIEWEDANSFERENESLKMMASILGLSEEQINAMWEQAMSL